MEYHSENLILSDSYNRGANSKRNIPVIGEVKDKLTYVKAWITDDKRKYLRGFECLCSCGNKIKFVDIRRISDTYCCNTCKAKDIKERNKNRIKRRVEYSILIEKKYGLEKGKYLIDLWRAIRNRTFKDGTSKVCKEWKNNPLLFCDYVYSLEGCFDKLLELDRIDTFGKYAPGNIRFATHKQNMRNTKAIKYVNTENRRLPVSQFIEEFLGLNYLKARILRNKCIKMFEEGFSAKDVVSFFTRKRGYWPSDESYFNFLERGANSKFPAIKDAVFTTSVTIRNY